MQAERLKLRWRSRGNLPAMLVVVSVLAGNTPTQASDQVFVPMGDNSEIAIVDAASHKVVGRIPGVPAVHGLAKTPDGELLIAGSFAEVEPGGASPERPAGISAEDHAAHHAKPADRPAAKDAVISRVSFVRTRDRAVTRQIDVPGPVHHVAASPDGLFAAVTHPNQDAVSIIDIRAFRVATVVKTGAAPNYAAFSNDGKRLYVSDSGDNNISLVDTKNWRVTRRIKVGESPEHFVIRPDLGELFVNNVGDGTMSVVSLKDLSVSRVLETGEDPHGIDVSEDGRTLYVSAKGADKMISIDLKTGERREVTLSPQPYHLKVIQGHGVIYVSSIELPKMWIVDPKAMKVTGIIDIGGKGHQMVQ
ncbi:MAG: hypothetical protein COW30_08945 [Rhodospirillales bacterium CG15_BIG_FIL_POST_REV_8_21_14_020_66_15]|nr:MAG: hypothetical protein COW30_08945 [Rhodospirillales bacterium CG15_BIG_FIL_POST_REV_8_21_14_020_66_15]